MRLSQDQGIILQDRVDQIILQDQDIMIRACNTPLVLHATRVIRISQYQGKWDLVLKDPDTMRVLQHNQQVVLLIIIQAIHACNTPLVLPATIAIGIRKEDQGIILQDQVDRMITITDLAMDLARRIVDRDRMVTITDQMTMGTRA